MTSKEIFWANTEEGNSSRYYESIDSLARDHGPLVATRAVTKGDYLTSNRSGGLGVPPVKRPTSTAKPAKSPESDIRESPGVKKAESLAKAIQDAKVSIPESDRLLWISPIASTNGDGYDTGQTTWWTELYLSTAGSLVERSIKRYRPNVGNPASDEVNTSTLGWDDHRALSLDHDWIRKEERYGDGTWGVAVIRGEQIAPPYSGICLKLERILGQARAIRNQGATKSAEPNAAGVRATGATDLVSAPESLSDPASPKVQGIRGDDGGAHRRAPPKVDQSAMKQAPVAKLAIATVGQRIFARLLDHGVWIGTAVAISGLAGTDVASTESPAVLDILFAVVVSAYEVLFVGISGSTPGKRVAGIVVRSLDGSRASWSEAISRVLLYFALGVALALSGGWALLGFYVAAAIGLLAICTDDSRRTPWDRVGGTVVVVRRR